MVGRAGRELMRPPPRARAARARPLQTGQTVFRTLLRRLLIPQVAVILAVAALVAIGGVVGVTRIANEGALARGLTPLVWAALLATAGGIAVAAIVAVVFARRQVADVSALFLAALPP